MKLLRIADIAVCFYVLKCNIKICTCAILTITDFRCQYDRAVLVVDDLSRGEAASIAFVAGVEAYR